MSHTVIRVGTDCSGIEAPIQALKKLKIPFTHEFSSEIDMNCIKSIKANYKPKRIYGDKDGKYPNGDIRERDHSQLPDIDLYVCGFPCQPFSIQGNRNGIDDTRGTVYKACIDTIKTKLPSVFILENVRGILTSNKGSDWKIIWDTLQSLSKYGYRIEYKILNTKDYGIPQNRERVFIIGKMNEDVIWFDKKPMKKILNYVDKKNTASREYPPRVYKRNFLERINPNSVFVDLIFINYNNPYANKYCSCILRKSEMWCIPMHRKATVKELLKLQGFPVTFKQSVSDVQLKYQIGNSMSINVLECILKSNICNKGTPKGTHVT